MFTGLIEELGTVAGREVLAEGERLVDQSFGPQSAGALAEESLPEPGHLVHGERRGDDGIGPASSRPGQGAALHRATAAHRL